MYDTQDELRGETKEKEHATAEYQQMVRQLERIQAQGEEKIQRLQEVVKQRTQEREDAERDVSAYGTNCVRCECWSTSPDPPEIELH